MTKFADERIGLGRARADSLGLKLGPDGYAATDIWRLLGAGEQYFWKAFGSAIHSVQEQGDTHMALGIGVREIDDSLKSDVIKNKLAKIEQLSREIEVLIK